MFIRPYIFSFVAHYIVRLGCEKVRHGVFLLTEYTLLFAENMHENYENYQLLIFLQ